MPTPTKGPRLGGSPAHQRLILSNLATALFEHGRITTTEAKARRLRPVAEKLITKAKRGDLHNRREVLKTIRDKSVVHTLFTEIAPTFAERPGGYTRITKIGPRKGDNAPMAVIELVTEAYSPTPKAAKPAKKTAPPRPLRPRRLRSRRLRPTRPPRSRPRGGPAEETRRGAAAEEAPEAAAEETTEADGAADEESEGRLSRLRHRRPAPQSGGRAFRRLRHTRGQRRRGAGSVAWRYVDPHEVSPFPRLAHRRGCRLAGRPRRLPQLCTSGAAAPSEAASGAARPATRRTTSGITTVNVRSRGHALRTTIAYPATSDGEGATPVCRKSRLIVAGHGSGGDGASAANLHRYPRRARGTSSLRRPSRCRTATTSRATPPT